MDFGIPTGVSNFHLLGAAALASIDVSGPIPPLGLQGLQAPGPRPGVMRFNSLRAAFSQLA